MPALDVDPPDDIEGGMSRVVIETDVPARVERVVASGTFPHRNHTHDIALPGLLCASTPCAVTLPYGDHVLHFEAGPERSSTVVVRVAHATEVVNHTLGAHHTPAARGLGVFIAATGLVVLAVGVALALPNDDGSPSKVSGETSGGVAAAGLGTMIFGGAIMGAARGTTQDGSTTQWSPGRTIGGAVGFRF